ncbi:hypothetical protein F8388_016658 [Cannabis sativa]|uniref:Transposase MuDR plant domain-containing protein n=1 Tax=Cannabis sativa TaxID=3483 RepID=A0A7J6E3W6_CANSA|nr:hypothetical protein F8388_016658 [Cannabis sativa]
MLRIILVNTTPPSYTQPPHCIFTSHTNPSPRTHTPPTRTHTHPREPSHPHPPPDWNRRRSPLRPDAAAPPSTRREPNHPPATNSRLHYFGSSPSTRGVFEPTSTFFTLKVHHKGTIDYTLNVPTSYNGGWPQCVTLECVTTDFVLTEKIAAALKDYDHEIECFFSHPQLNENVAYESEATFPTVVELGDVGKDAGPNLDDENVTPIKESGLSSQISHLQSGLETGENSQVKRNFQHNVAQSKDDRADLVNEAENEDESEEGSEDDYEEDPEYAQEDDGILIDEEAEHHLSRKGKKHVEIDVEDEDMVESDSEQVARDDSSEEDEGDENNGIQLNNRKKRFKKEKLSELPEFRPETDMGKAIFDLGLSFASGKLFKQAIREYALREGKDIFFKKNDPHRVRAQCKGVNCRWICYASKIDDSPTFDIKSYEAEHKCCRTNSNRWATAQWLSAKYREEFKFSEGFYGQSSPHRRINDSSKALHVQDMNVVVQAGIGWMELKD